MQFSKLGGATALGAAFSMLLGTAALADSIYIGSPSVIEQQVVLPSTTVVEERSVLVPQPTSTVIEERSVSYPTEQVVIPSTPAYVERQVFVPSEPETIMKRTMTVGTRKPAVSSTTSTDISLQSGPAATFARRIELMKEQVNLGLSKGLMSASAADSFRTRLNSLDSESVTVSLAGTPKSLSDSLEQKLTGLNIEIADSMNPEKQLGSGTQMQ